MIIVPMQAYGTAKWIVSPVAGQGTNTTIQSAINASSAGDTVFIRDGTYTENLTLKAGVQLVSYGTGEFQNVTIIGKMSYSGSGTVAVTGCLLQTNSDYILEVTGSSNSTVYLFNCYINATNNTAIHGTSSGSSSIILDNCFTNSNSGNAIFVLTNSTNLHFVRVTSTGAPSSAMNTTSDSAGVTFQYTTINTVISTSGSGYFASEWSVLFNNVTVANTGICTIHHSEVNGNIVINGTCSVIDTSVATNTADAISGSGTLIAGIITFTGTNSTISTSTVQKYTTFGGTIV